MSVLTAAEVLKIKLSIRQVVNCSYLHVYKKYTYYTATSGSYSKSLIIRACLVKTKDLCAVYNCRCEHARNVLCYLCVVLFFYHKHSTATQCLPVCFLRWPTSNNFCHIHTPHVHTTLSKKCGIVTRHLFLKSCGMWIWGR